MDVSLFSVCLKNGDSYAQIRSSISDFGGLEFALFTCTPADSDAAHQEARFGNQNSGVELKCVLKIKNDGLINTYLWMTVLSNTCCVVSLQPFLDTLGIGIIFKPYLKIISYLDKLQK